MKMIIGVLAYGTAAVLVVLAVFRDVPLILSTVGVLMLAIGALYAWSDKPTDPCRCTHCNAPKPKRATAEDVR